MSAPNHSTAWGRLIVDVLAAKGVDSVVVSPGSRSTPLVVAASEHPSIQAVSILDERSAAYYAVGQAKRSGEPTAIICTSGTAGANFHPAVIEADRSRTPLIVCTADRPTDLQTIGANQTIDQSDLYGKAVRYAPPIPEPTDRARTKESLQVTIGLAVDRSQHPLPGPVHLNIPFRKPLSPTVETDNGSPIDQKDQTTGQAVSTDRGRVSPEPGTITRVRNQLDTADRPALVCGSLAPEDTKAVKPLIDQTELPVFADPLSGLRFGPSNGEGVLGSYDAVLDAPDVWPVAPPDAILRFGARPTSVALRAYLAEHEGHHVVIDPAGEYRDPSRSTTGIVTATPEVLVDRLLEDEAPLSANQEWMDRWERLERDYWTYVSQHVDDLPPEGRLAHRVIAGAPKQATLFVSNSMPIRDVDRFGQPRSADLCVLGNRGASGIDGIVSTALGAASMTSDPAILLTGDLAFYHDMNGLVAIDRCNVDMTIVVVNNDGGGIFHKLPIAARDPPFTEQFRTPHGLEFSAVSDLYGLAHETVGPDEFHHAFSEATATAKASVLEVTVDGAANHQRRDSFQDELRNMMQ